MKKIILTAALVFTASIIMMGQTYRGNDKKTLEDKLNEEYCTGIFKSTEGTIVNLLDEVSVSSYTNILDWLQGRVAGLQVYTLRNGLKIPYIRGSRAHIFVDETPVDAGFLNALSVNDIAIIKVFKNSFAGGIGGNSAVAIYTIRPEEGEEDESEIK